MHNTVCFSTMQGAILKNRQRSMDLKNKDLYQCQNWKMFEKKTGNNKNTQKQKFNK